MKRNNYIILTLNRLKKTFSIQILLLVMLNTGICQTFKATYCFDKNETNENIKNQVFSRAIEDAIKTNCIFVKSLSTVKNGKLINEIVDVIMCKVLSNYNYTTFQNNSGKICYEVTAIIPEQLDFSELITKGGRELIKNEIQKAIVEYLPKYIPKSIFDVFSQYSPPIEVDFDHISDRIITKKFVKEINEIKGYSNDIDNEIEKINSLIIDEKKTIWGFRKGEFDFIDNNLLIEKLVFEVFKYIYKNLFPKLKGERLEILAIGYADEIPINENGLEFNSKNPIYYVPDIDRCPVSCQRGESKTNLYPAQPIYLHNEVLKLTIIGKKVKNSQLVIIKDIVSDNCQLSFSRGYYVINYLKKILMNHKKKIHQDDIIVDYAYSGKGIICSNVQKKRKVIICFRISRYNADKY